MPFQSTVNTYNALGIPGDIAFASPMKVQPYNLNSSAQAQTIGFAFTVVNGGDPDAVNAAPNAGLARVGGTGVFAGILLNPKVYASTGVTGNPLGSSLNLPDNSVGQLMTEGFVNVALGNTAKVGDLVLYDTTTGAITSVPPSSSFTGVVATNTLTVSSYVAGGAPLGVGSQITGANITQPTYISALGTGTGGNGTYTVTGAATVASSAMNGSAIAPSGKAFIAGARVARYDVAAAGVAVISLSA